MKNSHQRLCYGIVAGIFGLSFAALPLGMHLEENYSLPLMFSLRKDQVPPSQIVIVAIDEKTAIDLNIDANSKVWPRTLHAKLIEHLKARGASAIIFNLIFNRAHEISEDKLFADAIKSANNVVLAETYTLQKFILPTQFEAKRNIISVQTFLPPLSILDQFARGSAPLLLTSNSNINSYWTFKDQEGNKPTLPILAFQVYASDALLDFIDVLHKSDPRINSNLIKHKNIEEQSQYLRMLFKNDQGLVEKITQSLKNSNNVETTLFQALMDMFLLDEKTYLNFYGPPRTIRTIPYQKILSSNAVDPKGKIFFVGYSTNSLLEQEDIKEGYETSYSLASNERFSGVEIAATAVGNLLAKSYIRPIKFNEYLLFTFLWGSLIGYITYVMRPFRAVGICLFLSILLLYASFSLFNIANIWLPVFIPLLIQLPYIFICNTLVNYFGARRAYKAASKVCERLLPVSLVKLFVKNDGAIATSHKSCYGICLSTDVENYTTIAESLSPKELTDLMNRYYETLYHPIKKYGGMVLDNVGDSMLAVWTEASHDLVRRNACQAASEISKNIIRFNNGVNQLNTRIGLHTGPIMMACVGADMHYEYRAIGDTVNTSTRLQSLNKKLGTRLITSDLVIKDLDSFFSIRFLGEFLLAGKDKPIEVFEIMDDKNNNGQLIKSFGDALSEYLNRNLTAAQNKFMSILRFFPNDGPSLFYLQHIEYLLKSQLNEYWITTIAMNEK